MAICHCILNFIVIEVMGSIKMLLACYVSDKLHSLFGIVLNSVFTEKENCVHCLSLIVWPKEWNKPNRKCT